MFGGVNVVVEQADSHDDSARGLKQFTAGVLQKHPVAATMGKYLNNHVGEGSIKQA